MKLNTILSIASVFLLSHTVNAQENTKTLQDLLNAHATAWSEYPTKGELIPEDFLEQIFQLVADDMDPADPNTKSQVDPNDPDISETSITAMHLAAYYGDEKLILALKNKGANFNVFDQIEGSTPLHLAVRNGHLGAVALLLDGGALINAIDNFGNTSLHEAVRATQIEIFMALIQRGAKIDATNDGGETPLHVAARMGHVGLIAMLIELGANLHEKDENGNTPLHVAARQGNVDAISSLIRVHGANPNSTDNQGNTPLHLAALGEHAEAIAVLLQLGANINAVNSYGQTPFRLAALYYQIREMVALIEGGVNPNTRLTNGKTALIVAARLGDFKSIQTLLRLGAHPNAAGRNGQTALHYAARRGNLAAMVVLLQHGAYTNALTTDGHSPLQWAAVNGQTGAMILLIAYGANLPNDMSFFPNGVPNNRNQVAFILLQRCLAAQNLGEQRMDLIFDYVSAQNNGQLAVAILQVLPLHGETILHTAVRLGRNDILELVLNHMLSTGELAGAIDALNAQGTTALSFALSMQNFYAANLLLSAGATPIAGNPSSMTIAYNIPETDEPGSATNPQPAGEPPRKKRAKDQAEREMSLFKRIFQRSVGAILERLMWFTMDDTQPGVQSHLSVDVNNNILQLGLELERPAYLRGSSL